MEVKLDELYNPDQTISEDLIKIYDFEKYATQPP